jgi:hypothetical protein
MTGRRPPLELPPPVIPRDPATSAWWRTKSAPLDVIANSYIHIHRDGSASLLTLDRSDLELMVNDGALVRVDFARPRR